MTDAKF